MRLVNRTSGRPCEPETWFDGFGTASDYAWREGSVRARPGAADSRVHTWHTPCVCDIDVT